MKPASLFLAFGIALVSKDAAAQVHWDMGAEVAAEKRFLTSQPKESDQLGFGGALRLTGHVALFPLIRVGAYAQGSLAPEGGFSARRYFGGGLELRLVPPLRTPNWRSFIIVGLGYMRAVSPSANFLDRNYAVSFPPGTTVATCLACGAKMDSASGGCLDIPLGVGATYKLRKPFEVGGVFGTRIGAACHGDLYKPPGRTVSGAKDTYVLPTGQDRFGLWLGVLMSMEM